MAIETVCDAPAQGPALHPLIERLCAQTGAPVLEVAGFDGWADQPGRALLVFTEDPVMYRETLDLAVIVPELAKVFAGHFRTGVLPQAAARLISTRYGFRRWPALVMLKDGQYVGAIDGLRDWNDYLDEFKRLLAAEPSRAPSIGIAVLAAGQGDSPHCH